MANAETLLDPALATYRKAPSGVIPSPEGALPTVYGAGPRTESAPEDEIEYAETVPVKLLATYKNLPVALTATALGKVASVLPAGMVVKGEPGTLVRVVPLMEKAEMLLDPWLATKRNFPVGSTAIPIGMLPVAAVPAAEPREPSELIEYADTLLEPLLSRKSAVREGVKAIEKGILPVARGFPTLASDPELSVALYAEIVESPCAAK